jgi:hypothetical protein
MTFTRETDAQYHGSGYYGSGIAKAVLQSRRLAKDKIDGIATVKESAAIILGRAWDAMCTGGNDFEDKFVIVADDLSMSSKEGKAIKDANHGKQVLRQSSHDLLERCVKRMPSDLLISSMKDMQNQRTQMTGRTEISGVPVQMRADALRDGLIIDWKMSGVPIGRWPDHAIKMGYHIQAGWYRMVARRLTGTVHSFAFQVTESKAPHRTVLFQPDEEWLQYGDDMADKALGLLAECLESGRWDDPDEPIRPLHLPAWADQDDFVIDEDGGISL